MSGALRTVKVNISVQSVVKESGENKSSSPSSALASSLPTLLKTTKRCSYSRDSERSAEEGDLYSWGDRLWAARRDEWGGVLVGEMSDRWFVSRCLFNWLHTGFLGILVARGRLATEPGVADNTCMSGEFLLPPSLFPSISGLILQQFYSHLGKVPKIPERRKFLRPPLLTLISHLEKDEWRRDLSCFPASESLMKHWQ